WRDPPRPHPGTRPPPCWPRLPPGSLVRPCSIPPGPTITAWAWTPRERARHNRAMNALPTPARNEGEPWLPDLCRLQRLATVFGVAELAVVVVALAPDGGREWSLVRFLSASGFALWLALTAAVTLCALRGWFSRWPRPVGGTLAVAATA